MSEPKTKVKYTNEISETRDETDGRNYGKIEINYQIGKILHFEFYTKNVNPTKTSNFSTFFKLSILISTRNLLFAITYILTNIHNI